ncbi:MAG: OB-fold nucleic acid binding domain-containing protein, partial [Micromonosporaceae bacterium]
KRQEAIGQFDLFGGLVSESETDTSIGFDFEVGAEEWPRKTMLAFEREMLGLYVSSHPLAGAERVLRDHGEHSIAAIVDDQQPDGASVTIAGLIAGLQRRVTKQGKSWAIANVEDLDASIEVLFFPKSYEIFGTQLAEDLVVAVKGRVNKRDDGAISVVGMDLMVLDISDVDTTSRPPVVLLLPTHRATPPVVDDLKRILLTHPGDAPVHLKLSSNGGKEILCALGADFRVSPTPGFHSEVKGLLGAAAIQ